MVNGTQNFSSASTISGAGTLSIPGGTTTFAGAEGFTGGTLSVSGGTADFNAAATFGSMNFSSGTLGGAGNVTFGGTVNWTGGTMAGTGTTDIAAGATLNVSGNVVLQGVLENDGTANWTSGAIDMLNGTINNDGTWTANSTSTLAGVRRLPRRDGQRLQQQRQRHVHASRGRARRSSPSSYAGVAFNNAGTVNVSQGTLQLNSGGTNSAAINVSAGAAADFLGNYTHAAGSSLNGPGSINFAATQTVTGAVTVSGILNFSSGTIAGAGVLTATGTVNWTGGTLAGTGTTDIAAGATLNVSNNVVLQGVLENDGTANWTGGAIDMLNGTINNDGTWTANSTSTLEAYGGYPGGTVNAFNNNSTGTFAQQGTGTTYFTTSWAGVAFSNAGAVNVLRGTLTFNDGFTQTAGTLNLAGGSVSTSGTLNIWGGSVVGTGTITGNIANNGIVSVGGNAAVGTITVSGSFAQTGSGALDFGIGGTTAGTNSDQLVVSGVAALGGAVNVSLINGYTPAAGTTIPFLTYGSYSGSFPTITDTNPADATGFSVGYGAERHNLAERGAAAAANCSDQSAQRRRAQPGSQYRTDRLLQERQSVDRRGRRLHAPGRQR